MTTKALSQKDIPDTQLSNPSSAASSPDIDSEAPAAVATVDSHDNAPNVYAGARYPVKRELNYDPSPTQECVTPQQQIKKRKRASPPHVSPINKTVACVVDTPPSRLCAPPPPRRHLLTPCTGTTPIIPCPGTSPMMMYENGLPSSSSSSWRYRFREDKLKETLKVLNDAIVNCESLLGNEHRLVKDLIRNGTELSNILLQTRTCLV